MLPAKVLVFCSHVNKTLSRRFNRYSRYTREWHAGEEASFVAIFCSEEVVESFFGWWFERAVVQFG
jgi:hypothetical protein